MDPAGDVPVDPRTRRGLCEVDRIGGTSKMRAPDASVIAPRVKIPAPSVCRRAWVRFLHGQGATPSEIGRALGVSRATVDRLLNRHDAH
ncbi:MAG: helix-turn-helix domain-containing protein [Gammaproteobacteria bacterium]